MICFSVVRCTFVLLNMLINTLLQSVLPVITFMVIEVDFFFHFFLIIEAQELTHRVN